MARSARSPRASRWPSRRRPLRAVHADAVLHEDPSSRARLIGRGARLAVKPLLRLAPMDDRMFARLRSLDRYRPGRPAEGISAVEVDLDGVRAEWMELEEGPSSDLTLLYFHGGGFFTGSINSHRSMCEQLVRDTGGAVVSVDYVMLPDGTIADSVADAMTAYEAVIERVSRPDRIVVGGDSAGGYLAMKVGELSTRRGIHRPAGLIGFSPLLSLDPEREDKNVVRVSPMREAYLPVKRTPRMRERWLPDGAVIEGFASPLHAAAYIESPVHLVAVEDEMLRPETEAFALLLTDKGVDVEVHLWRGQVHAFVSLVDVLPDARVAVRQGADFARRVIGDLVEEPVTDPDTQPEDLSGHLAS
ncbi:alpha/beta hydrolase [Aeromicrobium piscarium]|uniref:Alpha/beta hydrolase n=1 Tax=Aeromicrobium piscarium TaxID=2590901 RepID=A0A554RGB0_9ACTN|nr:alpha/beta hydrolase [Aeromicrobium piscarium]TSD53121.1 alpha/beta hydrolase [Aeromicrobium piscarium]